MSKKLNSSFGKTVATPKNNLFNYFSKSPAPKITSSANKSLQEKENVQQGKVEDIIKKENLAKKAQSRDSEDECIGSGTKKRRRLVLQDSDEEEELEIKKKSKGKKNESDYQPSDSEEMSSDEDSEEDNSESDSSSEAKKDFVSYICRYTCMYMRN